MIQICLNENMDSTKAANTVQVNITNERKNIEYVTLMSSNNKEVAVMKSNAISYPSVSRRRAGTSRPNRRLEYVDILAFRSSNTSMMHCNQIRKVLKTELEAVHGNPIAANRPGR